MLRKDALDEREADYYEALYTQSQAQFGDFVQTGTVVNNYAHIFDLLIRLRQACHMPYALLTAGCSFRQPSLGGKTNGQNGRNVHNPTVPVVETLLG